MIKYRKGFLNRKANALSRKVEYRKELPSNKATIFTKGKDGLIRLYDKTLVIVIKISFTRITKEIRKA